MNIENTTFSEQFRNSIEKSLKEATSMPLAHKYMIAHFLSLVQAPQEKNSHNIAGILLKMALNTITLTTPPSQ